MSVYSKIEDIKPLTLEEFKLDFKFVTGRDFVEGGQNDCEVLYLSCNQRDLRFFVFVTENPNLAPTVRIVVVDDARCFEELAVFETFKRLAGPHSNHKRPCILQFYGEENPKFQRDWDRQVEWRRQNPSPEALEEFLVRKHKWVQEEVDAHLSIREENLDRGLLLRTIKQNKLPNLIEFVLTQLPMEKCNSEVESFVPPSRSPSVKQWEQEFEYGPIPLTGVCPRGSWACPMRQSGDELDKLEQQFPPKEAECFHLPPICAPFRGLCTIIQATQVARTPISKLSIIPSYHFPEGISLPDRMTFGTSFPLSLFLSPLKDTFRHYLLALHSIVENLTVLRLAIDCSVIDVDRRESFTELLQLLGKARKLKVLDLSLEAAQCNSGHEEVLDFVRSSCVEELHLDGVFFTKRAFFSLLDTLTRKHHSLKKLTLEGCILTDQSWFSLLEEARSTQRLRSIEELYVNHAYGTNRDGDISLIDFMDLPDKSRRNGIARWRHWKAHPSEETFPLRYEDGSF